MKILRALASAWVVAALGACNGNAVLTLTATPSTDGFLAYRVSVTAVKLQGSGGSLDALPKPVSIDFVSLYDVGEVLGTPGTKKGSYNSVAVTFDFSAAQIVYDDGSLTGVLLAPVDSAGKPLTQATVTVNLDSRDEFKVSATKGERLSLALRLAASNAVDLGHKTVTVTPVLVASAAALDAKQVRLHGNLASFDANQQSLAVNLTPFDTPDVSGRLGATIAGSTTFEINGTGSVGGAALTQLAAGVPIIAYGTFASSAAASNTTTPVATGQYNTTPVSTASQNVTFVASQVLAGIGVKQPGLDRVSGLVAARQGNTVFLKDATLLARDGSSTLLTGTTSLNMGVGTRVTLFGQGTATLYTIAQVSVGSVLDALGLATVGSNGDAIFDATSGRVRVGPTDAAGQAVSVDSGGVTVDLASMGNRQVKALDFIGTGADPAQYLMGTGTLDLSNLSANAAVVVQGYVTAIGAAPPDFTALTLLDPTTINAELAVDWGSAGTSKPFVSFTNEAVDIDAHNSALGTHHHVQQGGSLLDITSFASDPILSPSGNGNALYSIAHAVGHTVENFESYQAFITQLQSELAGSVTALAMSAEGPFDISSSTLTASSITLLLND